MRRFSSHTPFLHAVLQVKAAAAEAGAATFALMGNRDIAALVPDLLGCVARPGEVADVVTKLSATTFVQVGVQRAVLLCYTTSTVPSDYVVATPGICATPAVPSQAVAVPAVAVINTHIDCSCNILTVG